MYWNTINGLYSPGRVEQPVSIECTTEENCEFNKLLMMSNSLENKRVSLQNSDKCVKNREHSVGFFKKWVKGTRKKTEKYAQDSQTPAKHTKLYI